MTSRDKEILNKLTVQLNKMRGIETPLKDTEKAGTENEQNITPKIKSIPLGVYVDTQGEDKARIK